MSSLTTLSHITVIRHVYISSKARTDGTSDDFTINVQRQRWGTNPRSIKPVIITIPHTWSNVIDGHNNTISITGTVSGTNTFSVAAGNYSGTEFAELLEAALTANTGVAYTVEYESATGKFTIASGAEQFSLDFSVGTAASLLGFADGEITATASSATSSGTASLLIDTEVWVCTDWIDGVDVGVLPLTDQSPELEQRQIIAAVPITAGFGCTFTFQLPSEIPYYPILNSKYSDSNSEYPLRFYLRFPSGAPISLNGYDWTMQVLLGFNK